MVAGWVRNAVSGHKMFITAGSVLSGGKVWGGGGMMAEMKREAETQTAARKGGGKPKRYTKTLIYYTH